MNIWIKIFGYTGGMISCFTLLVTLIYSIFHDYKIIITTNSFNECWIEIIILSIMFFCILYMMIKEKWNGKKIKI